MILSLLCVLCVSVVFPNLRLEISTAGDHDPGEYQLQIGILRHHSSQCWLRPIHSYGTPKAVAKMVRAGLLRRDNF